MSRVTLRTEIITVYRAGSSCDRGTRHHHHDDVRRPATPAPIKLLTSATSIIISKEHQTFPALICRVGKPLEREAALRAEILEPVVVTTTDHEAGDIHDD
jgi:hypothetical protein